ncbi:MAG: aldehyde dehydrogenase family protein [Sulfolobales archaeon]
MKIVSSIIKGEPVIHDEKYKIYNPADTREIVSEYSPATLDDVKYAFEVASETFSLWSSKTPHERAKILYRAANIVEEEFEDLARLLTREMGKTINESRAEVERVPWILRFYASLIVRINGYTIPSQLREGLILTVREPLGVVSVITPWNFPISIPAWKIVPAIATGNTVVFKPASITPTIAYRFVEILHRAGLPPGVVNLIIGSGGKIGREMVTNKHVEAISFTGSTDTGTEISRIVGDLDRHVRLQLELGGKNATIVTDDAPLNEAVEIIVRGAFAVAGQVCAATSRVIVHRDLYDKLVEALKVRIDRMKVGNGLDPSTDMGPLASMDQKKKVLSYIEIGKNEGAKLVYGGYALESGDYAYGYYVKPTLFTDCEPKHRIFQEEIFGPVLCVTPYSSIDEAIELANSVKYGLVLGIVSRDPRKFMKIAREAKVGVVRINRQTTGMEFQAPFGGVKASGNDLYKEQGIEALDFYTRIKTIYMHW